MAKERKATFRPTRRPIESTNGSNQLRFCGDVVFDIETAPQDADHEDGALLNPETARVAAIGYYDADKHRFVIVTDDVERDMLRQFWDVFRLVNAAGFKMIGFNNCGFDLPFLVRRSWQQCVKVPRNIMTLGGRYWCDTFVDLMIMWRCGAYREFISLDALARFLGVGAKNGTGALFYRLWQTDMDAAVDYLVNDLSITYESAIHMGAISPPAQT